MKRTILTFLNRLGLYTRNQTRLVLGQPLQEVFRLWHKLPSEARTRFADRMLHQSQTTAAILRTPSPVEEEDSFRQAIMELLSHSNRPHSLRELLGQWISQYLPLDQQLGLREDLARVSPMDYSTHPITLHVDSTTEADLRSQSCGKEPGTVAWIEEHLRPGDVLYDIGANVGAFSLIAAKHCANQAAIFAFEPSYLNFFQLCRNILLNGCEPSVTPLYLPLCRQTQLGRFHYQNLDRGGSLHSFGQTVNYKGEEYSPVASIGTVGFSLNDWVSISGIPSPTLIKLDVDGLEKDILLGAANVLRSPLLRSVLVELNEDLADDCETILEVFHQAGLTPREKHPLSARLHNYLLVRATQMPKGPPRPGDVASTIERAKGFLDQRRAAARLRGSSRSPSKAG